MARLRILSGKEVCALLRKSGFEEIRRRGSHVVMQKKIPSGTVTVPVPDHAEIRIGTLQSIIRQCGVGRSEFEEWFEEPDWVKKPNNLSSETLSSISGTPQNSAAAIPDAKFQRGGWAAWKQRSWRDLCSAFSVYKPRKESRRFWLRELSETAKTFRGW